MHDIQQFWYAQNQVLAKMHFMKLFDLWILRSGHLKKAFIKGVHSREALARDVNFRETLVKGVYLIEWLERAFI